jgi:hypothetical protein
MSHYRHDVEVARVVSGLAAELQRRMDESERGAMELPHRSTYLFQVVQFLRRFHDLHLDLVDEVESTLGATETDAS